MVFKKFTNFASVTKKLYLTMIRKIALISALVLAIMLPASMSASSRGEKTIGVLAGFNTRNTAPFAGISFTYSFSNYFRIAPNIRYVFRNEGIDGYIFAVDGHIPFKVSPARSLQLYPIVGVAYSSRNIKSSDDVTTRDYHFGANAGFGVNFNCTSTLRLSFEGRYTLIKDFPTANISAGISYCF